MELIRSKGDSVRKAREAQLIQRGKTLQADGINKRIEFPRVTAINDLFST